MGTPNKKRIICVGNILWMGGKINQGTNLIQMVVDGRTDWGVRRTGKGVMPGSSSGGWKSYLIILGIQTFSIESIPNLFRHD
jgi:hypothetical protein